MLFRRSFYIDAVSYSQEEVEKRLQIVKHDKRSFQA